MKYLLKKNYRLRGWTDYWICLEHFPTRGLKALTAREGHFLMNYTASESTHLTLRFYDQGVEELYSPLEMDILEGEGSIGIPHAYLNRGVGIHGVYVTAEVASGELTIDTRGVFFTLDAGNFAEAVDDISMDVRDITMRQLLESNGPDQIWVVGIEDGKMLVSRRDYSESYSSNPKWTGVYTAGEAIDAAIEFDGTWALRSDGDNFTIETEDQPWYFWVTPDNVLLAQRGEVEESRVELDTGVTAVSACRGIPVRTRGLSPPTSRVGSHTTGSMFTTPTRMRNAGWTRSCSLMRKWTVSGSTA